ncbi:hypothetical protein GGF32_000812 [Allomyces javanicus]|nr:hypothetical protein GGF32_000812 [Allomyces javanicus]
MVDGSGENSSIRPAHPAGAQRDAAPASPVVGLSTSPSTAGPESASGIDPSCIRPLLDDAARGDIAPDPSGVPQDRDPATTKSTLAPTPAPSAPATPQLLGARLLRGRGLHIRQGSLASIMTERLPTALATAWSSIGESWAHHSTSSGMPGTPGLLNPDQYRGSLTGDSNWLRLQRRKLPRTSVDAVQNLDLQRENTLGHMYEERVERAGHTRATDLEEIDNVPLRQYHQRVKPHRQVFVRFAMCCLLGLVTVSLYYALHATTELFQHWRVHVAQGLLASHSYLGLWGFLLGVALVLAAIAMIIVLVEPGAAGSGMPEVIAFLNGLERPYYLSSRMLIAKLVGMFCVVNSGLFSGYDGPLIHSCAIAGIILVRNLKRSKFLSKAYFGVQSWKEQDPSILRNARSHELQTFATLGAACGVSSAFQAPMAGVMFAIEEAISFYDGTLIVKAFLACSMTILFKALLLQDWTVTATSFSIFAVNAHCDAQLSVIDYIAYVVLGLLGGLFGHWYNRLVAKIREWREWHIEWALWRRILDVFIVVVVTISVCTGVVYLRSELHGTCTTMEATLNQLAPVAAADRCTRTCSEWLQLRNATSSLSKRQANRLQVMSAASTTTAGSGNPLQQCINDFATAVCVDSSVRELIMEEMTQQWLQLDVYCALNSPMSTFSLLPSSQVDVRHLLVHSTDLDTSKLYPTGLFTGLHAPESTKAASASTSSTEFCYDPLASLFFNQPERVLNILFFRGYYGFLDWAVLLTFGVTYCILTLATHNIAAPTDLVMPCLVLGATFGRLFGLGVNVIQRAAGVPQMDPGVAAVLGLAAFWAGTSRMMMTVVIIALQSTNEQTYLAGIMIVVIIATVTGNYQGPSQYHLEMETMGMAYLPHFPPHSLKLETVEDVLLREDGEVSPRVLDKIRLNSDFTVAKALDLLKASTFSGWPVVDAGNHLLGFLLRVQLEELILEKAPDTNTRAPSLTYDADGSSPLDTAGALDDHVVDLGARDVSLVDDVAVAMNLSPHVVFPDTLAAKAYKQFRNLGLRHLLVVSRENVVVGILTRSDFHRLVERGLHLQHHHHHHKHKHAHDDDDSAGHRRASSSATLHDGATTPSHDKDDDGSCTTTTPPPCIAAREPSQHAVDWVARVDWTDASAAVGVAE